MNIENTKILITEFPENFPEEYKTGKVHFLWKDFWVNPMVLIPRLETEVLIKRVRNFLWNTVASTIVDIGSGSGIIGVSLAKNCEKNIFVDIDDDALSVAKTNFYAHYNEKKADFIVSDLLANVQFSNEEKENIILVANLPYIKNNDWKNMSDDTRFEPRIALFGGEKTGFELYEKLFSQIIELWLHGKLFIEFGFDQRKIAEDILSKISGWKTVFFADYAGIERFAEISF